jgi:hypothetical protein
MAKQTDTRSINPAAAMKQVERDAYLAYKEWPVWLHLRLKEVERHLAVVTAGTGVADANSNSKSPVVSTSIVREDKPVDKKKSVVSQLGKAIQLNLPNTATNDLTEEAAPPPFEETTPAVTQMPLLSEDSAEVTEAEVLDFLATFDSRRNDR